MSETSPEAPRKRKWDEPAEGSLTPAKVAKVEEGADDSKDALDAAAEVAARIAAQYAPKPTVDVPYVAGAREANDPEQVHSSPNHTEEYLCQVFRNSFIKDIEIHDIRNRYLLTKGPTQKQIFTDTGASVTTKGVWYPDKSMATDKDPPLYLHITAETAEQLEAGVKAVQELIDQELGPLIDQSRFRDRDAPRERRKWPEEKILLELEPLRNFNVRAKVVGPGGLFVKFIQQETQTRVQIKGVGSGFVETETGRESEDPIHIHVTGPDQVMVEKATEMAKDLHTVVKEEWAKARAALDQPQQQQQHQQHPVYQQYPQQQQQQQQQQYGYNGQQAYPQGYQQPYGAGVTAPLPSGEAPPPPPPDGSAPAPPSSNPPAAPVPAQQAGGTATPEEWAAYWNALDPASQAYYTQYYAQAYAQPAAPQAQAYPVQQPQQAYPQAPSSAPPPPPPTPSEGPKGGSGAYGAVPPPAGL